MLLLHSFRLILLHVENLSVGFSSVTNVMILDITVTVVKLPVSLEPFKDDSSAREKSQKGLTSLAFKVMV